MFKVDFEKYNSNYISNEKINKYDEKLLNIKKEFTNGSLNQWINTNTYISNEELNYTKEVAKRVREMADVFVVIGIGGSYMGAKAVISALSPKYDINRPEIVFFGINMNPTDYNETLNYIKDKDIVVNVISKSGTTLEPSIAFESVLSIMKDKYTEEELKSRIIITTDREKGTLRELVNEKGYTSFVVPSNVGGRYSVLTPVGMLPIAVAGFDIDKLLLGAKKAIDEDFDTAMKYAVIRDILYNNGKNIESFTIYNDKLFYFTEWLKQLFAESHGKNNKGLLPISNINSRDLHSLGQFLQDGKDIIFETVIGVEDEGEYIIPNLNYDLNRLNNMAVEDVAKAHSNGNTPSNIIWINKIDEESIGELIQFFILSCITGGYLLEINPFDQPGVEEYKKFIKESLKEFN